MQKITRSEKIPKIIAKRMDTILLAFCVGHVLCIIHCGSLEKW